MKKYSEFELIGIGITLLVLCILISLIGKHVFDLEGDYLSAAATLFAAVVAMLLFNDWREEYQINKLETHTKKLEELSLELRKVQNEIQQKLLSPNLIKNISNYNLNKNFMNFYKIHLDDCDLSEINQLEIEKSFMHQSQVLIRIYKHLTLYSIFLSKIYSTKNLLEISRVKETQKNFFVPVVVSRTNVYGRDKREWLEVNVQKIFVIHRFDLLPKELDDLIFKFETEVITALLEK